MVSVKRIPDDTCDLLGMAKGARIVLRTSVAVQAARFPFFTIIYYGAH
jgi:hypothetical protein